MRKQLLALGTIALLFAACKKNDNDTTAPMETKTVLSGLHSRTDSTFFNYDASTLNLTFTIYYYKDGNDIGGGNEYYKYSNGLLTSVWAKGLGETDSVEACKLAYTNNKLVQVETVETEFKETYTYDGDKINTVTHYGNINDALVLTYTESIVWSGNNIQKVVHTGKVEREDTYTVTYTYDNKPNPFLGVKSIMIASGFDALHASANNVLTETKTQEGVDNEVNTYTLSYNGDQLTQIISDTYFGNSIHDKDTLSLVYKQIK